MHGRIVECVKLKMISDTSCDAMAKLTMDKKTRPSAPMMPKKIASQSEKQSDGYQLPSCGDSPKTFSRRRLSAGRRSTCLNHLSANSERIYRLLSGIRLSLTLRWKIADSPGGGTADPDEQFLPPKCQFSPVSQKASGQIYESG